MYSCARAEESAMSSTHQRVDRLEGVALAPAELRSRRLALRLTQARLGAALGVTPTTLARWERAEQVVGRPAAIRLALERLETQPWPVPDRLPEMTVLP